MANVADSAALTAERVADVLTELQSQSGQLADLISATEALAVVTSGEWAPTVVGGTTAGAATYNLNGQVGRWRKIGDTVLFAGRVDWSAHNGTGDLRISLPLAAANITNLRFVVDVVDTFLTWPAGSSPVGLILPGLSYFTLVTRATNAAFNTVQIDTQAAVSFSGWYITG